MVVQGLIEAEKEQRKRQKKQKGFVEEEEEKPKLEELEADYGAFENGDTGLGDRRSVTICPSDHISDPTPAGCTAMFGGLSARPCPVLVLGRLEGTHFVYCKCYLATSDITCACRGPQCTI